MLLARSLPAWRATQERSVQTVGAEYWIELREELEKLAQLAIDLEDPQRDGNIKRRGSLELRHAHPQFQALPRRVPLGGVSTLEASAATICFHVTNPSRVALSRRLGICLASQYPGFRI